MMKYNFVYKTTNNLNGDYYYGVHSTNNLNDGYLGSGKILKHSVKKYGKENFTREIVQYFSRPKCAYHLEAAIITHKLLNDTHCLNITTGGHGGNTLCGKSEEELCSLKQNNPAKRPEVRQKMSDSKKQYYIDHPEAKQRLSDNNPMKREDVRQKTRHKHIMSEDGLNRLKTGAEKRKGSNNGVYGKTFKWMNDGIRNYRVDLDKVEYKLNQGLKIGLLKKS